MKPILPALPGGILKEFDMHQARLGYPPIAQWVADENPIAATPRTAVRPRLSEEEQARRRALDTENLTLEERGWIEWGINGTPVLPPNTRVQYKWLDHEVVYPLDAPSSMAKCMLWTGRITAFRVVKAVCDER